MAERPDRPRLIPVLDVMDGHAVRAVGGDRQNYQPIACPFTGSRKPLDVAVALQSMSTSRELYIADLDAIMSRPAVSPAVCSILDALPVPTWLDAGIGRIGTRDIPPLPHLRPVVGFETCWTPELLAETLAELGGDRVAFSIDLRDGRLLGNWRGWQLQNEHDSLALARRVVEKGVRTLIVLDLARVGRGSGVGTEPLLESVRRAYPNVQLIAGGGVRTQSDVDRLGALGVDAVLVASALHQGTLGGVRTSHNESATRRQG